MTQWLTRTTRAFEVDPLIDEYAVLPEVNAALFGLACTGAEDADEGLLVAEHKLALSVEAALVIYRCAFKALQEARCQPNGSLDQIAAVSRAVLLCNADCVPAWSSREELLLKGALETDAELHFNALLLRTNHKSSETWVFRRQLLASALTRGSPARAAACVASEMQLVEELAKKYDHHYYAWNHWAWLDRFCKELPQALDEGSALSFMSESFPRLVHVTPSHYGLFHHKIVRLAAQLKVTGISDSVPTEGSPHKDTSSQHLDDGDHAEMQASLESALPVPPAGLESFIAERQLAASLLSTFPFLEAPWLFRLQGFATLLESCDNAALPGPLSTAAVSRLVLLWKSEVAFAREMQADPRNQNNGEERDATFLRFLRRFRVHVLQELSMHMHIWWQRGIQVDAIGAVGPYVEFAKEALDELEVMEHEEAAAPVVLRGIRADLEAMLLETPESETKAA